MGVQMETQQEREWAEAQKIRVSIDLVQASKIHLKFLAAVGRNRFLFEDHALQRAIYRYNAFWLPLLAKHLENPVIEGSLVVPLDCEWIWHCHRLNPVRYIFDCKKLFGRILGNRKVISSVEATSKSTTEETWNKMYPEEPYELDLSRPFSEEAVQKSFLTRKFTNYDLLSAVKRQISFVYQVSKPYMLDDLFLQEAAARYKGFLHLIRTNRKMKLNRPCVPTYDIDLMWHTHQLNPESYCKDAIELVEFVIQHDDTDSDRSKGGKLGIGYSDTTKQWEQTFGFSYWKAGTRYTGSAPSPVTQVPYKFNLEGKESKPIEKIGLQIHSSTHKTVEVLLEFADIKNLPEEYKDNFAVVFSKTDSDQLFSFKSVLGVSSNSKEKQVAGFQCEPKGGFLFELMSFSTASDEKNPKKAPKILGSCSLSWEELFDSGSKLWTSKWISVDLENSEPLLLQLFMSFTPPTPATQVFQLEWSSQPLENDKNKTHVVDASGNKVFSLEKRDMKSASDMLKEVDCITNSGENHALVECNGDDWSLKGTDGSFKLRNSLGNDESLFELLGDKMVKLFPGRRLDFEHSNLKDEKANLGLMTAVEFSTEYPYGKAIALIDFNSGLLMAKEEWIVLPGIALTFMLTDFITTERGKKKSNINGNMVKNGVDGGRCLVNFIHQLKGEKCDVKSEDTASQCESGPPICWGGCYFAELAIGNMAKTADTASDCYGLGPNCYGDCNFPELAIGNMDKTADNASACMVRCVGSCWGEGAKVNMAKTGNASDFSGYRDYNIPPCHGPCATLMDKTVNASLCTGRCSYTPPPCVALKAETEYGTQCCGCQGRCSQSCYDLAAEYASLGHLSHNEEAAVSVA